MSISCRAIQHQLRTSQHRNHQLPCDALQALEPYTSEHFERRSPANIMTNGCHPLCHWPQASEHHEHQLRHLPAQPPEPASIMSISCRAFLTGQPPEIMEHQLPRVAPLAADRPAS